MAVLANGYTVTIKQKVGNTNTNIYPITRSKNVITAAGHDLETFLDEIEASDGSVKKADTSGTVGIVALSSALDSNSETVAATAAAAKALKTAIDNLEQAASDAYVLKTQLATASSTVVDGYLFEGKFYEEAAHTTEIIPAAGTIYKDKTTGQNDKTYAWDVTESEFVAADPVVGVATLDTSGKVPAAQLPSYVDDVIEAYYKPADGKFYTNYTPEDDSDPENPVAASWSGEITPESGKIYVDLITDKTYRWGGSVYTVISETLALGRTNTTAFPGDAGLALENALANDVTFVTQAFEANDPDDHTYTNNGKIYVQTGTSGTPTLVEVYRRPWLNANSSADNPDGITKSTIGLGNVENKDAATIISEITLSDLETTVGYANSTTGGLMSSTYADKLDNCMEIAVSATAPSFTNGLWIKIEEDETVTP